MPNKSAPLALSVGEKLYIYGSICGRFSGHGVLKQNRLQVALLQTAKPTCHNPEYQQLDQIVKTMLRQGVRLSLRGQRLTLETPRHRLIYRLEDLVG